MYVISQLILSQAEHKVCECLHAISSTENTHMFGINSREYRTQPAKVDD